MSTFEIKMPKLGESITEGTIVSWSVKVGDTIQENDVLFEVNTAKVSAEIPSPVSGKVIQLLFNEGDTVPVGTVVALVNTNEEETEEIPETPKQPLESTVPKQKVVSTKADDRWYSPVVLQLAGEAKLANEELSGIPGSGYLGRLSKKDIKNYIEQKTTGIPAPQAIAATPPVVSAKTVATPLHAAPIAAGEGIEVHEMDRVRRIIADHMVLSKKTSPHVTTVVEVDVTKLVRWRQKNKEEFARREGISLTYMPAITESVAKALIDFPQVNASVDGYNILFKKHINIGIAVSLNDGNLIVPVIHDADQLNMNGLALAIDSLAAKARDNKLQTADIEGGTFTITNFGSFRSLFGTPIINQPQVAILGVGYIEKKPAVVETSEGDVIAIRHKMYLSLSYDHRAVDGSLGGNFLRRIANYLEQWNG